MKNKIVNWIKDYSEKSNLNCLIIGISGGVDSALTSTLCAETGIKTIVVSMVNSVPQLGQEYICLLSSVFFSSIGTIISLQL